MNAIFKFVFLNLLLLVNPYSIAIAADPGASPLFSGNPFLPENENTRLKGVHILSVDDQAFPDDLKIDLKRIIAERKKNCYLKTTASRNQQVKNTIKAKKLERTSKANFRQTVSEKEQLIKSKLALNVQSLTNTPLSKSNLIDIETAGALNNSSWSGVSRLFEDGVFGSIILTEDDFSLHGGAVIFATELVNTSINGNAGILTLEINPGGEPYTTLQWVASNKSYELRVAVDASKGEYLKMLITLAESLY